MNSSRPDKSKDAFAQCLGKAVMLGESNRILNESLLGSTGLSVTSERYGSVNSAVTHSGSAQRETHAQSLGF